MQKKRKRLSIQTTWMLFVFLVVFLPASIFLLVYGYKEFNHRLEDALLIEERFNHELKINLQLEVSRIVSLLQNESDTITYLLNKNKDSEIISVLLEKIFQREAEIRDLLVVSDKGRIVAALNHEDSLHDSDRINILHFVDSKLMKNHWELEWEKSVRSPEFVVPLFGRVYIGATKIHNGQHIFNIAVPLGDVEQTAGILLAEIDIASLWIAHQQDSVTKNGYRKPLLRSLIRSRMSLKAW